MVEGGLVPPAPLSLRPCIVLKDHLHHLTKYEGKGTKVSVFKLFSEFEMKIWKCNLGFSKIPISHLFYESGKAWNPNVQSMDELGKFMS